MRYRTDSIKYIYISLRVCYAVCALLCKHHYITSSEITLLLPHFGYITSFSLAVSTAAQAQVRPIDFMNMIKQLDFLLPLRVHRRFSVPSCVSDYLTLCRVRTNSMHHFYSYTSALLWENRSLSNSHWLMLSSSKAKLRNFKKFTSLHHNISQI